MRWLELENLKRIGDIGEIAQLRSLIGFGFDGEEGSGHAVRTWKPLENLADLTWLKLGAVQSTDGSLRPLGALTRLKWLGLARRYEMKEFAWLASRLATTECAWLQPFMTTAIACARCKTAKKVMVSGKGKPTLCPACDKDKLEKHVQEFESAKAEASDR
jgi:hypothetical protein